MKFSGIWIGVITFLVLFFFTLTPVFAASRGAINIAAYWREQFQEASSKIGENGNVNIMICPGDVPQLNALLAKNNHPKINLWIRGHLPGMGLDSKMAADWGKALKALDTRYKVFFFPVNEPNGAQENGFTTTPQGSQIDTMPLSPTAVRAYTDMLRSELGGLVGTKVELVAPTIDPFASYDQGHAYITKMMQLDPGYFGRFYGVSLSQYGEYNGGFTAPNAKIGKFLDVPQFVAMGAGRKPTFIESGILCNEEGNRKVAYGSDTCFGRTADSIIAEYFTKRATEGPWNTASVFGPSIFSYNPDPKDFAGNAIANDQNGWIFNSQTLGVMTGSLYNNPLTAPVSYGGQRDPSFDGYLSTLGQCFPSKLPTTPVPTQCNPDGVNDDYKLTVSQGLQAIAAQAIFNINILDMKGVGQHEVSIKPDTDYLPKVARYMLPNYYELRTKEAGICDPTAPEGKALWCGNMATVPVTLRSQISTNNQIDAVNPGDPANGGGVASGNQVITSINELTNTQDLKDARIMDDYQHTLSTLTGNQKITKNTAQGINLTKPPSILADNAPVPANSSNGVNTSKVTSGPAGDNLFQGTNGAQQIGLTVTAAITDLIANILNTLLGTQQTEALARAVNIPLTLESCTKISNDKELQKNVKNGATALLPHTINRAVEKLEENGQKANKFTNPVDGSDAPATIDLTQKYTYTNKVIAYQQMEECKSLSYHDPEYTLRCGKPLYNHVNGLLPLDSAPPVNATPGDITAKLAGIPEDFVTRVLTDAQYQYLMARVHELEGRWANSQLADPARQAAIHQFALANGVNEAFLYALWVEETHASAVGTYPFGCDSWKMNQFDQSLNCVVNDPVTRTYMKGPFSVAMCKYADGHYPCDFSAHPNFIPNLTAYIKLFYQF